MAYKIVVGHTPEELSTKVTNLLKEGWVLAGGLAIGIDKALSTGVIIEAKKELLITATEYGNYLIYCQAMSTGS